MAHQRECAVPQQRHHAGIARIKQIGRRHAVEVPSLISRALCRHKRAAPRSRLHDGCRIAEAAENAGPLREIRRKRLCPRHIFRDHQAVSAGQDALPELLVFPRIIHVQAAAEHRDRRTACIECGGMRTCVHALRKAADDHKIVLTAQTLGLNTCWVAGTFGRKKCKAVLNADEKIVCVISLGYGESCGVPHKSKPEEKLCNIPESQRPDWFKKGLEAAILAPTALNQQKFFVSLEGENPVITTKGGAMTQLDLGIVKFNFEAASGHKCN